MGVDKEKKGQENMQGRRGKGTCAEINNMSYHIYIYI